MKVRGRRRAWTISGSRWTSRRLANRVGPLRVRLIVNHDATERGGSAGAPQDGVEVPHVPSQQCSAFFRFTVGESVCIPAVGGREASSPAKRQAG